MSSVRTPAITRAVAVLATATLLAQTPVAPGQPRPLVVLLAGEQERKAWEESATRRGWALLTGPPAAPSDALAKAVRKALEDFRARTPVDATRVYLAGQGRGAAAAFYLVARLPDLWAAALAVEGSPKPAIDTGRLFAANAQLVPMLWITSGAERSSLPGFQIERRNPAQMSLEQALDWLAQHERDPFPPKVDCESGNPELARCYWIEMTRLDFSRRNDVLPASRLAPGSGASLALGGFGFDPAERGPGLVVGWLPQNYQGPLKLDDRIVAVAGKEIRDGQAYLEFMDQVKEEQRAAVMVQRGKERLRIETRIVLPKREEAQTARVQAEFLSDTRELLLISRGVAELRLDLPRYWVPCPINWNGLAAGQADSPGCWIVSEGSPARRCP